jgi:hypothetical protein
VEVGLTTRRSNTLAVSTTGRRVDDADSRPLIADGAEHALDPDHVVRVGPTVKRMIVPGPDGIRLLALGGVPGSAYDDGASL